VGHQERRTGGIFFLHDVREVLGLSLADREVFELTVVCQGKGEPFFNEAEPEGIQHAVMRKVAECGMVGKGGAELVAQPPPAEFDIWRAFGGADHEAALALFHRGQ